MLNYLMKVLPNHSYQEEDGQSWEGCAFPNCGRFSGPDDHLVDWMIENQPNLMKNRVPDWVSDAEALRLYYGLFQSDGYKP